MKLSLITTKYQDVHKNGVKFAGRIAIEAKSRGIKFNLPRLITEREDIKPLLDIDWLRDFNWTLRNSETTTTITNHSEKAEKNTGFEKIFKTNPMVKNNEIKKQLEPGQTPAKQNARVIPYHLQSYCGKETINVIQTEHFGKVQKVEDVCFVTPVVTT